MTIQRGQEWGTPTIRPADLVVAGSDAELGELVAADPSRPYGIAGGDLYRSLGEPPERHDMQRLPMDAMRVEIDGRSLLAVAHVVARNSWWSGRIVAVVNAGHVGEWNVAPRAHPNDGRLDVIDVAPTMTWRQRLQARRRLPLGAHLPHPSISARTVESVSIRFDRPTRIDVDGVGRGQGEQLTVTVLPDHFAILI